MGLTPSDFRFMVISLTGKKILITGATGAIGGAILEAAREAGAWSAGSYFRDEPQAERLRTQGILMEKADLTDRDQARAFVHRIVSSTGDLDALVYCAGNTRDHTLPKLTDEEWDEVFQLHLEGLVACTQALLPSWQNRRSGKLIAIGSMSGEVGRVGQAHYSAAKAATVAFVKSMAKEMGRFGITANVVCPGFVDSKMTRAAPPQAWERAKTDSALGTISSVEVAASFVTWLLSDLCTGVTGQLFNLDSRIV